MKILFLIGMVAFILFAEYSHADTPPGKPLNVTLKADDRNIAVQWNPPSVSNEDIRRYIVTWAILPSFTELNSSNIVYGNVTISFIAVNDDIGRLFRVRVRAENSYGIGEYSTPRYIRIGCGNDVKVVHGQDVLITSPGYNAGLQLKTGVICRWRLTTDSFYTLTATVKDINLYNNIQNVRNIDTKQTRCDQKQTFVNVSNVGLFCKSHDVGKSVTTRQNLLTVTLMTGLQAGGRGFSMLFSVIGQTDRIIIIGSETETTGELSSGDLKNMTSKLGNCHAARRFVQSDKVKSPGPPTRLTVRTTSHAVIIAWQRPIEKTLPITSYTIRYKVLPNGQAYRIVIGALMTTFSVNTDQVEGKLLLFNVTASIQNLPGLTSSNVYVRAPCQRSIYLQPGQSVNITSPNYPYAYPNSIVCFWSITCSPEATLRMTYYDFRLEDMPFCSSDYIKFSYKREPECARMKLPRYYSTGLQAINVTFVTDNRNQYQGFLINFLAEAFSSYRPPPSNPANISPLMPLLPTSVSGLSSKPLKLLTNQKTFIMDGASSSMIRTNMSYTQLVPVGFSPAISSNISGSVNKSATESILSQSTTATSVSLVSKVHIPLNPTSFSINTSASSSVGSSVPSSIPSSLSPTSNKIRPSDLNIAISSHHRILSQTFRHNTTNISLANMTSNLLDIQPDTTPSSVINDTEPSFTVTSETIRDASKETYSYKNNSINSTNGKLTFPFHSLSSFYAHTNVGLTNINGNSAEETTEHFEVDKSDSIENSDTNGSNSSTSVWSKPDAVKPEGTESMLTPIVLSVGGTIVIVCLVTLIMCRRYRRHRKIDVENSSKYRAGHIELHDILQDSTATGSDSAIFKTISSRDVFLKTQSRKRRSTFPLCYSLRKRKVHSKVQREMAAFGSFIEDKDALEKRLRRKHAHRRTNSF